MSEALITEFMKSATRRTPVLYELRDEDLTVVKRGVLVGTPPDIEFDREGRFQLSFFVHGRRQARLPIKVSKAEGGYQADYGLPRFAGSLRRSLEARISEFKEEVESAKGKPGFFSRMLGAVKRFFADVGSTLKEVVIGKAPEKTRQEPSPESREPRRVERPRRVPRLQEAREERWLRLWTLKPEGLSWKWQAAPWPAEETEAGGAGGLALSVPADRTHVVQYPAEKGTRYTVLPPGDVVLRVDPRANRMLNDAPIDIDVSHSVADNLMGFLVRGDIERARALEEVVIDESLVFGDDYDAVASVVGAYYLQRFGQVDRMRSWCARLADRGFSLPDAAIVQGWTQLQAEDDAGARAEFLRALRGGLPVFTDGLRLLADGLRMFPDDQEIGESALTWRRYVNAVRWTEPYTTFTGQHPSDPRRAELPPERPSFGDDTVYRIDD